MQNCGNCMAFKPTNGGAGECHLTPPQVIFMGFQQGRLQGQPPQPMIAAAFPGINADNVCLQWQSAPTPLPTIDTIEVTLPPRSAYVDHTAEHVPARHAATGLWWCDRCKAPEYEFATTPCNPAEAPSNDA